MPRVHHPYNRWIHLEDLLLRADTLVNMRYFRGPRSLVCHSTDDVQRYLIGLLQQRRIHTTGGESRQFVV
jgi:hypothetical protein